MNVKVKTVMVFKAILQLLLFITFMKLFGIASFKKLQRKETIVVKSDLDTGGIEDPAVTIQATKNNLGWKSVQSGEDFDSFDLFAHCKQINLTVEECVQKDSIKLMDFLENVELTDVQNSSASILLDSSNWKEDMTMFAFGRHFTFKSANPIILNADFCFAFFLVRNFTFQVFVHDPDFFLYNSNPNGPPSNYRTFQGQPSENHFQELTLTKHTKLNLDRQPCEEDPVYSFTDCIKEKLATQVGT